MSNGEYPRIVVDHAENSPESGEMRERKLISPIETLDSSEHGRRATFSYDGETETYSLESYEAVQLSHSRGWRKDCLVFQPSDIDVLEFMGEHLKISDGGGTTVSPFGGASPRFPPDETDGALSEPTECYACGRDTHEPNLTGDSHTVGPNQWVCGDCRE